MPLATALGFLPLLLSGGLLYLAAGLVLTVAVNVPMNEALAHVVVPESVEAAQDIWTAYSSRWQAFNVLRTVASAGVLVLCGTGLLSLARA